MEEKFHGAIFDLDGTLLDSLEIWSSLGAEYLEKKGIPVPSDLSSILETMTMEESSEYFFHRWHPEPSSKEILATWISTMEKAYRETLPLFPGVAESLYALHERGLRFVLATSAPRIFALAALERHKIKNLFIAVLSTEQGGPGKESPDIFLEALGELGTAPEKTLLIEDAPFALKTGQELGLYTVGVVYGVSEKTAEEMKPYCRKIIDDPGRLEDL